jgi:CheY-like chemotaxis protein
MLLDLRLPRVSGLEVLRQVKQDGRLRALPVVVLTTSDAERDMSLAYEYHVNSYLTKPVDFDAYIRMMKDLGLYWLDWNRLPENAGAELAPIL